MHFNGPQNHILFVDHFETPCSILFNSIFISIAYSAWKWMKVPWHQWSRKNIFEYLLVLSIDQRLAVAILGALSHALDPGLDLGSDLGKHVRVAVEAVHPDCREPDYKNWALDTFYTNVHLPFSMRFRGLPESPPLVPWCEALSPVVQRCRVLTMDSAGDTR